MKKRQKPSNEKDLKKKIGKQRPSIYSITILLIILFIIAIILLCIAEPIYLSFKYKEYTKKMERYGFNLLYDNEQANSRQKTTQSEIVKVVIGSILNTEDISNRIGFENNSYENEAWIVYAEQSGLIEKDSIKQENNTTQATYKQAENLVIKAIKTLLDKDIENDDIYAKILDFKSKNKKYNKIIKGELNKLIITVVEYYSTIYYNAYKTDNINIIKNKEQLPLNYTEYPYIIDSIDKEIYEIPFIVENQDKFETPKQEYIKRKEVYSQIEEVITNYFDTILNIDYQNITNDSLFDAIKNSLYYENNSSMVDEYVKYVKKYKIKLQGKCTVLLPIIYNTGEGIRVRVKIEFRMLNSNTDINILLPDVLSNENIKYTDFEHELYCDVPMGIMLNAMSLKVNTSTLVNYIVSNNPTIERIKEE